MADTKNLVVDVASFQGDTEAYFQALANRGVKGVVVKLTESTTYTSPKAANQIKYTNQFKMRLSVYHFARFSTSSGAESEANYFLNAIKNYNLPTSTVVVCDYEKGSGSAGANEIDAFYQVLEAAGYKNVCVYSSRSWFQGQLSGTRGLHWVAEYGKSQCSIPCDMWQYSSEDIIGGYNTDTNWDYNGIFSDPNATGGDNNTNENDVNHGQQDGTDMTKCYSLLMFLNSPIYDKWLH